KLAQSRSDKFVPPSVQKIAIDELVTDLIAWYRAGFGRIIHDRERFIVDVESRWRLHLQPFFGGMKANMLNTAAMSEYRTRRLAKGATNTTINRELQILRKGYRLASESEPPKVQHVPKFADQFTPENNARKVFIDPITAQKMKAAAAHEGLWTRVFIELAF